MDTNACFSILQLALSAGAICVFMLIIRECLRPAPSSLRHDPCPICTSQSDPLCLGWPTRAQALAGHLPLPHTATVTPSEVR